MATIIEDSLDIVIDNLFAVRSLCDVDAVVESRELDEYINGVKIFISGKLPDNELPEKFCLRIRGFYSYIFEKEFRDIDIKVDCEYDLIHDLFELHIYEPMSEKENKTREYLLDVDDSTEENNCRWKLSLKDKDLERIKYLKEVCEESVKRFGDFSSLNLSFNVTYDFHPEPEDFYPLLEMGRSELLYVGNDEFIVSCDFNYWGGDMYSIVTTKPFKI